MRRWYILMGFLALVLAVTGCIAMQAPNESAGTTTGTTSDASAPDAFLTLNLDAGNRLDPLLFSVNGGGEIDASTLATGCAGFITPQPVLTLNWQGDVDHVEAFFYSDFDPTLLIQQPNGEYLCSDNANQQLLDPVIDMPNPPHGRYNIWVGAKKAEDRIPGFLVLTTLQQVNVGDLDLGALVKRGAIPYNMPAAEQAISPDTLKVAIAAATGVTMAGGDSVTTTVSAEGQEHVSELGLDLSNCSGFINTKPDFVFDWSGTANELNIFFESNNDSALVVVTPSGDLLCSDDTAVDANLNPLVTVENPAKGSYGVFVSRLHLENPITGTLTIAPTANAEPSVLAPDPEGK